MEAVLIIDDTVQFGSPLTKVVSVVMRPSAARVEVVVGTVLDTAPSVPMESVDEAALRLAAMELGGKVDPPLDEGERMP